MAFHTFQPFVSLTSGSREGILMRQPDGFVVRSGKIACALLKPHFERRWLVGEFWFGRYLTNIGSGAESPLPGAWELLGGHYQSPGLALSYLHLRRLHPMLVTPCGTTTSPCSPTSPRTTKNGGNASSFTRRRWICRRRARRPRSSFWHPWLGFHGGRWSTWSTRYHRMKVGLTRRWSSWTSTSNMMVGSKCLGHWRNSFIDLRGEESLMQYRADYREARRELEKHKITGTCLLLTNIFWIICFFRPKKMVFQKRGITQHGRFRQEIVWFRTRFRGIQV